MKRPGKTAPKSRVIALALTWDGARWPVRTLPSKARAFLGGKARTVPSAGPLANLLARDEVKECRICWVPGLKGGGDGLAAPFATVDGKRVVFQAVKTARFGEILGVVYRRLSR